MQFDLLYSPEPNTGCWLWLGPISGKYSRISYRNKNCWAHIISFILEFGYKPKHTLHHTCKTKLCVNPYHLVELHSTSHGKLHGRPVSVMTNQVKEQILDLVRNQKKGIRETGRILNISHVNISEFLKKNREILNA